MQAVIRADGARGEESPGRGYQFERSEKRRVGEEGRSRWAPDHLKKKRREEVVKFMRRVRVGRRVPIQGAEPLQAKEPATADAAVKGGEGFVVHAVSAAIALCLVAMM